MPSYSIIGSDLPLIMRNWKVPDVPGYGLRLWSEVPFLVYDRAGYPIKELPKNSRLIRGAEELGVSITASSSEVRNRRASPHRALNRIYHPGIS